MSNTRAVFALPFMLIGYMGAMLWSVVWHGLRAGWECYWDFAGDA